MWESTVTQHDWLGRLVPVGAATFVKDSAITTAIKTKLAGEHVASLGRIHVDTDKDGVVWLTGSARTQEAGDKAASIARDIAGRRGFQAADRFSFLIVSKDAQLPYGTVAVFLEPICSQKGDACSFSSRSFPTLRPGFDRFQLVSRHWKICAFFAVC